MNEPRLKKAYNEVIRPQLSEKFNFNNLNQVPAIDKNCVEYGYR